MWWIVSVALLTATPVAAAGPPAPPCEACTEAIELLHDGRFDEAEEVLGLEGGRTAGGPAGAFVVAFVTYWRLLYDPESLTLRDRLGRQLGEAIGLAEARIGAGRQDPEAALWAGSSRLLRAQLRAAEKKPLAAAFEARRAKRFLDKALESEGRSADSAFGLGTYLYVADRVPALVKGLRTLLFLPGGNRERGLELLHRAADASRFFALDARLLLMTLYAHRREGRYEDALREARKATGREPAAIVALHAAGKLHLGLGLLPEAASLLDRALVRASAAERTAAAVRAGLELDRALVDLGRFRPDLARRRLEPLASPSSSLPGALRERLDLARASASVVLDGPRADNGVAVSKSWQVALPSLEAESREGIEASVPRLIALAEVSPDDPTLSLLGGRALLLSGHAEAALGALVRAETSGNLPPPWTGPCLLMAGQAADLTGRRKLALAYYRRALEAAWFPSRDAATFHQSTPYRGAS